MKRKWGVKSIFQVILIMVVFSVAGSSVVVLRKAFFHLLGYTDQTAFWIKAVTYILFIFPSYQILLLIYGAVLGQFSFFWEKEKKLIQVLSKPFRR